MSDVTPRPGPGYPRFFGELSTRMGDVRRADRRRYLQFFAELSPRLDTAKALELELDRHLARRFNVFDYLSTIEVGLSRIIADLLNPEARHGQGTLFLRTLLDELTEIRHRPDLDTNFTKRISVVTERVITNKRRLDISVEIPGSDGTYCLAIENKPYADDQPNQVKDYLAFLQREYADRFLLIYLSPTGQGPSRWSLPCEKLDQWEGRLAIMAYWGETNGIDSEKPTAEDRFAGFRVGLSLAAWFSACRRRCEPDRLRWFLSEAEVFCRHEFGGHSMATDSEDARDTRLSLRQPEAAGDRAGGLGCMARGQGRRLRGVSGTPSHGGQRKGEAGSVQHRSGYPCGMPIWWRKGVVQFPVAISCEAGLRGRPVRSILHARDERPSPCNLDRQAQTVGIGVCSTRWTRAA